MPDREKRCIKEGKEEVIKDKSVALFIVITRISENLCNQMAKSNILAKLTKLRRRTRTKKREREKRKRMNKKKNIKERVRKEKIQRHKE